MSIRTIVDTARTRAARPVGTDRRPCTERAAAESSCSTERLRATMWSNRI